jgi:hypothetical protein
MGNAQPSMNNIATSYVLQDRQRMYNPAAIEKQYPNYGQKLFNNDFNNFAGPPMNGMDRMIDQKLGYYGYGGYPGLDDGYGGLHADCRSSCSGPGIGIEENGRYGIRRQDSSARYLKLLPRFVTRLSLSRCSRCHKLIPSAKFPQRKEGFGNCTRFHQGRLATKKKTQKDSANSDAAGTAGV